MVIWPGSAPVAAWLGCAAACAAACSAAACSAIACASASLAAATFENWPMISSAELRPLRGGVGAGPADALGVLCDQESQNDDGGEAGEDASTADVQHGGEHAPSSSAGHRRT